MCEGAVPHILALAAILGMDAELWVDKGKPAESHEVVSLCWPVRRLPRPTTSCPPQKCSHRIAVESFEWMAMASQTPISSWLWTSPEGPSSPWSSCRSKKGLIGEDQRETLKVMRPSFLSQSPCLPSLGLLPHGTLAVPRLVPYLTNAGPWHCST